MYNVLNDIYTRTDSFDEVLDSFHSYGYFCMLHELETSFFSHLLVEKYEQLSLRNLAI